MENLSFRGKMPKPGITQKMQVKIRGDELCMNGNYSHAIIGIAKKQPLLKEKGQMSCVKMLVLEALKR